MKQIYLLMLLVLTVGCGKDNDKPVPPPEPPVEYEPDAHGWSGDFDDLEAWATIMLYVRDAEGNNLLDRDFEGHILDDGIYNRWLGPVIESGIETTLFQRYSTRMPQPVNLGPNLIDYDEYEDDPVLMVGDFMTGWYDFDDEQVNVYWGDGTYTELTFDSSFAWAWAEGSDPYSPPSKSNPTVPVVVKRLWIDGELVSEDSLVATIVK